MNGLPIEVIVVLGGIGVVALTWLLLRFGKIIARAGLVAGVLAVVIVGGLALLSQAEATQEATAAAQVASVGQAATSAGAMLCIGGLGAVALVAGGAAGVFYVRWRLADRRRPTLAAPESRLLSYRPRRQRQRPSAPEIVYLQGDYDDGGPDDLFKWGW